MGGPHDATEGRPQRARTESKRGGSGAPARRSTRAPAAATALAAARTTAEVAEALFDLGLPAVGATGAAVCWQCAPGRLKVLHERGSPLRRLADAGTFRATDPGPAAAAFRTGA
ncbi:MAG TPA: hypothetical protein VGQ83_04210, partial [Polyangia bacterium]